jgi:hypothetical protein
MSLLRSDVPAPDGRGLVGAAATPAAFPEAVGFAEGAGFALATGATSLADGAGSAGAADACADGSIDGVVAGVDVADAAALAAAAGAPSLGPAGCEEPRATSQIAMARRLATPPETATHGRTERRGGGASWPLACAHAPADAIGRSCGGICAATSLGAGACMGALEALCCAG